VLKAEAKAFGKLPENDAAKPAEAEPDVALNAVEESQRILQIGSLFDLCNKRIEKYQAETEARARWSFYFSVIAMIAGLSVVLFAAKVLLKTPTWEGASVAAIGGAISTFITKTFLDVHKLSLQQPNHYFRQPVLHSHILTAQRLADQLPDQNAKQDAYKSIINKVLELINAD
jgi:hypothetical protein